MTGIRRSRNWLLAALPLAALAMSATWGARPVHAFDVNLKVTIEEIHWQSGLGLESADFYAIVTIDGQEIDNKDTPSQDANEDDDDIAPYWEFTKSVDFNKGSVPVVIQIMDEDGFLRFDDDTVDISGIGGSDHDLTVNLAPCSITGELNEACDTTIVTSGNGGGDGDAELRFRIAVEEPPSAPGLNVRCTHTPLWPDEDDTVTIQAEVLDGVLGPKFADTVEIWVNDKTAAATSASGTPTLGFDTGPFSEATFAYGCRVVDDGVPIFTGWRVVSVGPPAEGLAIPVIYTGPRSSRIDIVIIPDGDNYSGPTDPAFLTDAAGAIKGGYYSFDQYLANQDKFNFWLAHTTGDAEDVASGCDHVPPGGSVVVPGTSPPIYVRVWDLDYAFADTGFIVHTDSFRDCAPGGERLFSSEPTSLGTIRHETGHSPFGLADEYCCDGGYFQADPHPNVYEEPDDCSDDAGNLGRVGSDCREFVEPIDWWFDYDWSVSEPASNDLMVDNTTAQAADKRRMNWVYANCQAAGC